MHKEKINDKRNNNIGLNLLRLIMCFCVVLIHFWTSEDYSPILEPFMRIKAYAVPVFMFMSFFLTQKRIVCKTECYIKKRLWRLIWPQIGWTIIYCGIYFVLDCLFGSNRIHGLSDFIWQLFTGHSDRINAVMWYQIVLIIFTLLFGGIFYILPTKNGILCILTLLFVSIVAQYSEINWKLFGGLRFELKYPLGRICEVMPFAIAGFVTSYMELNKWMKANKIRRFLSIVFLCVLCQVAYKLFVYLPKGFGYAGIQKTIVAFGMVMIAVLLPLDELPQSIKMIANSISKYTMAVYCMHNLIGRFMISIFQKVGLESGTFFMCVVVYIVCYMIAFWGSKVPIGLCKQLLE